MTDFEIEKTMITGMVKALLRASGLYQIPGWLMKAHSRS